MKPKGFTLIELLVSITIIGILLSLGISAYAKARDRQEIRAMGETILLTLKEAQKAAIVGDKDCNKGLNYIQVSFTADDDFITTQTFCTQDPGTPNITQIENMTFQTSGTIKFKPLNGGMDLGGPNEIDIDFSSDNSNLKHRIKVQTPGSITYYGETP